MSFGSQKALSIFTSFLIWRLQRPWLRCWPYCFFSWILSKTRPLPFRSCTIPGIPGNNPEYEVDQVSLLAPGVWVRMSRWFRSESLFLGWSFLICHGNFRYLFCGFQLSWNYLRYLESYFVISFFGLKLHCGITVWRIITYILLELDDLQDNLEDSVSWMGYSLSLFNCFNCLKVAWWSHCFSVNSLILSLCSSSESVAGKVTRAMQTVHMHCVFLMVLMPDVQKVYRISDTSLRM